MQPAPFPHCFKPVILILLFLSCLVTKFYGDSPSISLLAFMAIVSIFLPCQHDGNQLAVFVPLHLLPPYSLTTQSPKKCFQNASSNKSLPSSKSFNDSPDLKIKVQSFTLAQDILSASQLCVQVPPHAQCSSPIAGLCIHALVRDWLFWLESLPSSSPGQFLHLL